MAAGRCGGKLPPSCCQLILWEKPLMQFATAHHLIEGALSKIWESTTL